MAKVRQGKTALACLWMAAVFFLLIAGCSGIKSKKTSPEPQVVKPQEKGPRPLYYDFGDILIPGELKVDNKSTYIVETPGFRTGVLAFKGRVDRNSVIAFFENNMAKDNWKEISSFKSPRTSTILLFQKQNRWCVISINEKDFNTYVEVGVAPALGEPAESGLLK